MSNFISLICKNCGGHLSSKNNSRLICDYCGSEIIIDNQTDDFIIIAGKLEYYTGSNTDIVIPKSVISIGNGVFANQRNINSVVIADSVINIEKSAFEGCTALSSIYLPKSVKIIGDYAFKNSGLKSLTINNDLDYIGQEAFMSCNNLSEIKINGSIKSAGLRVFKKCNKLVKVNVDLHCFAGSLKPLSEAKTSKDKRITFFDFFQGTPFYDSLKKIQSEGKCLYCNSLLQKNGKCQICEETNYDKTHGCYIATCVYGSYDCPEVWTLRRYRDNTLGSTWYGRAFIRTYYAISPTLVKWFGKTKWFKKIWKGYLDKKVKKLQNKGVEDTPYDDKEW